MDLISGDALQTLSLFSDNFFQCVVTSPPYWGLRDYGTAVWEGGDPLCDHMMNHQVQGKTEQRAGRTFTAQAFYGRVCGKCGAVRTDSQIGHEETPGEYVKRLVGVLREVRRVLKDDGTLWLNLGDSYSSSGRKTRDGDPKLPQRAMGVRPECGLGPKQLVGIPWRVALALQEDGWCLRQDIIWSKPNAMPESVTDRCTKSHEYIFMLTKNPRYYFDSNAIQEPSSFPKGPGNKTHKGTLAYEAGDEKMRTKGGLLGIGRRETRNKRDVWSVSTKPYRAAHFATFPPDLIRPCILAGCPLGGEVLDPFCGSGTVGVVCKETGRNFTGIDLNPEYLRLAEERIEAGKLFE